MKTNTSVNPINTELKAYHDCYNDIRATESRINELINQEQGLVAAVKEAESLVVSKPSIGASVADIKALVEKKIAAEKELDLMKSSIDELHKYINMERGLLQDKRDMNQYIISDCWQKLADSFVMENKDVLCKILYCCLLYTSPSPRDRTRSRMPSSA